MKWTGSEFCYLKTSRNELQQLTYSLKKSRKKINTFLDVTKVWHQIASLNDIAREKPKYFPGAGPPPLSEYFPVLMSEKTVLGGKAKC